MGEVYCLQENNIESKEQSKFSEFITDKKKIIICTVSVLVIVLAAASDLGPNSPSTVSFSAF